MPDAALVVENYSFWYKVPGATGRGSRESQGHVEPSAETERGSGGGGRLEGRSSGRQLALEGVSFEVELGSLTLVLGTSGAGKSTLALNLVGVYPDFFGGWNEGRILVNHAEKGLVNRRELDQGQRFRTVNMLFQNPEDQIVTMSVEEEVGFALENYLVPPAEIDERVDRGLELVGLTGFRERPTLRLSGGEKQRVALAAMLAMEPRVLILDEPTSNLDPAGTEEVLEAIDRIRERLELALLLIEHEVDHVFDKADQILLVDGHRVHGPMTPRDFLAERGLDARDGMGLWIPQASEVGLGLRAAGVPLPTVPLSVPELVGMLRGATTPPAEDTAIPADTATAAETAIPAAETATAAVETATAADDTPAADTAAASVGASAQDGSAQAGSALGDAAPTPGDAVPGDAGELGRANGVPGGLNVVPGGAAAHAPGETVIQVRDLDFDYPRRAGILRGVNLDVRRGEMLAVVGQNGSGKSTLAAQLNGILKPTRGEVLVHGKATTAYRFADLAKRVAYIFQVPEKQFIRNTVREEMTHGLKALKLPAGEIDRRVREYLEQVRLADRTDASPYVLSHGQKRRLSVACMVVGEPDVIILDEPTFGQDHQQAQRLMTLLRKLADVGAAVMFITHDMRLVAAYADRCAALAGGEVIFDGAPLELFGRPEILTRARLSPPPVYQLARELLGEPFLRTEDLVRRLSEAGQGISPRSGTAAPADLEASDGRGR